MYFGENKRPNLRRNDPEKELLAEQNALLKQLLSQQAQGGKTSRTRSLKTIPQLSRFAGFAAALTIVVCGLLAFRALTAPKMKSTSQTNNFPAVTIHQIKSFTFYYLKPGFQTAFALQRNTITIQSGVLVFQMKNSAGMTLAFTEEQTPSSYDISMLQTTTNFNTPYGKAFVTDESDRTTGGLFTNDKTWVLINAPKPIGVQAMEQVLNALKPTTDGS